MNKIRTMLIIMMGFSAARMAHADITGVFNLKGGVASSDVKLGINGKTYGVGTDGSYVIATAPLSVHAKSHSNATVFQTRDGIRCIGGGDANTTKVTAYGLDGSRVLDNVGFTNNFIPLHWNQKLLLKLSSTKQGLDKAAARSLNNYVDTMYIIVGGDTLREVPLISWDTVLPANYIVQWNLGLTNLASGYQNPTNKVEYVFWNNDSIAHVISASRMTGTASTYTVYSDSAYRSDAVLFKVFARIRNASGKVLAYSFPTTEATGKAQGTLPNFGDTTAFFKTRFVVDTVYGNIPGYTQVQNDSSVGLAQLKYTNLLDTVDFDSLVKYGTMQDWHKIPSEIPVVTDSSNRCRIDTSALAMYSKIVIDFDMPANDSAYQFTYGYGVALRSHVHPELGLMTATTYTAQSASDTIKIAHHVQYTVWKMKQASAPSLEPINDGFVLMSKFTLVSSSHQLVGTFMPSNLRVRYVR